MGSSLGDFLVMISLIFGTAAEHHHDRLPRLRALSLGGSLALGAAPMGLGWLRDKLPSDGLAFRGFGDVFVVPELILIDVVLIRL
jgi:hypothetical protein